MGDGAKVEVWGRRVGEGGERKGVEVGKFGVCKRPGLRIRERGGSVL